MLGASFIVGLAVATLAAGPGQPSETTLPAAAGVSTQPSSGGATGPASFPAQTTSPPPSPSEPPASNPTPTVTPAPDDTPRPDKNEGEGPAEVVLAFYVAVATHEWKTARDLWSPDMQLRYPPDAHIVDRFSATQRIHINLIKTVEVDRSAGTARVEVTMLEYRTVEPSPRRYVGAWDLVRIDGRWLLHAPDF